MTVERARWLETSEWRPAELENARPLSARAYTSAALFDLEVDRIFRRDWLAVGRAEELADVGSYKAIDLFGEPILLVRDAEGVINGYANVCRHRSVRMLDGCGKAAAIQCPYHLWTYGLDGALKAAPFMERSAAFNPDTRLPLVRTEVWNGWIFACLNEMAPSLADHAAELAQKLEPLDLASWRQVAVLNYDSPWNWKVMVENFAESYHVMSAHKQTLQPFWPAAQSAGQPTDGSYAELHHSNDPTMGSLTIYILFPSFMIAVSDGGPQPTILWYDMSIEAHGRFDLSVRIFIPAGTELDDASISSLASSVDLVHQEDIPLCAAMQRGLSSRYAAGEALSHLEQPLKVFHDYLASRLLRT